MNKVYIFDVDGTLTPSRQKMTEEFKNFFLSWSEKNFFFLVSGSDLPKLKEQLDESVINRALGVFCCAGNTLYLNNEIQYDNKFNPPKDLIEYLERKVSNSQYSQHYGNHIEDRGSMLNFSVVGRDCTQEQREDYFEWDKRMGERNITCTEIKGTWPSLDAVVGGQISVDIYPKGNDKSQILPYVEKILKSKVTSTYLSVNYNFIGDKTEYGGNDYPLAEIMNRRDDSFVHKTGGPEQTQQILESLND
tara:strand:- start:470 stop:1213 length:744 start_codon:yes stop_codon:yes gene_type:complete